MTPAIGDRLIATSQTPHDFLMHGRIPIEQDRCTILSIEGDEVIVECELERKGEHYREVGAYFVNDLRWSADLKCWLTDSIGH